MDRRIKSRLDLQLRCRIGGTLLTEPVGGTTENVSRSGFLLRWVEAVPLPAVGARLTVDVELPRDGLPEVRLMRCRTTVIRITAGRNRIPSVALHIDKIRFVRARSLAPVYDLESMPVATQRVA